MLVANELLASNKISGVKGGDKSIEKYEKLLKAGKLSKSQKSAKSRKELSKSGNLPIFHTKENRQSFLTPDTKMAFNYL